MNQSNLRMPDDSQLSTEYDYNLSSVMERNEALQQIKKQVMEQIRHVRQRFGEIDINDFIQAIVTQLFNYLKEQLALMNRLRNASSQGVQSASNSSSQRAGHLFPSEPSSIRPPTSGAQGVQYLSALFESQERFELSETMVANQSAISIISSSIPEQQRVLVPTGQIPVELLALAWNHVQFHLGLNDELLNFPEWVNDGVVKFQIELLLNQSLLNSRIYYGSQNLSSSITQTMRNVLQNGDFDVVDLEMLQININSFHNQRKFGNVWQTKKEGIVLTTMNSQTVLTPSQIHSKRLAARGIFDYIQQQAGLPNGSVLKQNADKLDVFQIKKAKIDRNGFRYLRSQVRRDRIP